MTAATNITSIADRLSRYDADPAPRKEIELLDLPEVVRLSEVEPKPIQWLWPGWLPKGMLTILGGFAGDGKSTITLALAAALSTGSPLPDGSTAPITNTLILPAEDDIQHVVAPRLIEQNADTTRVLALTGKGGDGRIRSLDLKAHIEQLRQLIRNHDIGLLVIDPISSYLPGGDRNSEGDTRDALAPLMQMAEETGVAVLGIMHIGKSEGYQRATQRLMGSSAFVAVARSVWMLAPLPEDKQVEGDPLLRVLGVEKSNYSAPPKALLFSRQHDSAVEFHGESPMSLSEVFAWKKPAPGQEKGSEERDAAIRFLYAYLADGMKRTIDIEREGLKEGHTRRMLRRAKDDIGVMALREDNLWHWKLPEK